MTTKIWLKRAASDLQPISNSSRLDAELLLCNVLELPRTKLLSDLDQNLTSKELATLDKDIQRRMNGEPIAYIVGSIEFYGHSLLVDKRVLCPRPETETLVEYVIKTAPQPAFVVDVGTGSGAISIAVKKARSDLSLTASDFSADALAVARKNIADHKLEIDTVESNLLDNISGNIDIVIANLPYLPDNEPLDESVLAEPREALISGEGGLRHYRKLFEQATSRTSIHTIYVEALPSQTEQLSKIAQSNGFILTWNDNYIFEFNRV